MAAKESPLKIVMSYFGMTAKQMMTEWKQLSDQDKEQIMNGITDGTLTY